jgi:hypothetical protein
MSLDEMIRTIIKAGYEVRKNEYLGDKADATSFFGVFMATICGNR